MSQYRLAIIGTGKSVNNHIEAVRHVGDRVDLVAAVDLDADRVKAVCQECGIPHSYTDVDEMLADENPDLVCIVTPPATHIPLAVKCMEAGAWVYCEKPLCTSLAEFDRLAEAEARTGCYTSTVAQWRFGSAVEHLNKLIAAGELGKPLVGICNTLWYRDLAYYQVPWRGKWASEIGGPTVNLGIHLMDLFLSIMGDWHDVQAMIGTLDRPIEVEDISMAMVRFENGAMGSITNSVLSPRQETYMRLDFQQATVEVSALYRYTNENWRFSTIDESPDNSILKRWESIVQNTSGMHGVQLAGILDSMARKERPFVSGSEARRILEFIASLYKSASIGQPVVRGSIDRNDPFYHAMSGNLSPVQKL